MNKLNHDLSTLDADALAALPALGELPHGRRLGDHMGNGCAGDPPGYPTYFTQSVYTAAGDEPRTGATLTIAGRVLVRGEDPWGPTWEEHAARREARMRALYKPLPFEHPRVQAWVRATHQHLHCCYRDVGPGVTEAAEYGKPAMLIYPVPNYKLRSFHDDERFSDAWRAKDPMKIYVIDLTASALPDARPAPPEGVFVVNDDPRTRDQRDELVSRLARVGYSVRVVGSDGGLDDMARFVESAEAVHHDDEEP